MKTIFLEQSKKMRILKKVTLKNNKIFINQNLKKASLKSKIKIVKKIKNILESQKARQLCIEKDLKNDIQFINLLHSNNINLCTPKWIFKQKTDEIISQILKDKKREETEIFICVNEVDSQIEKYIYKFAKEFKTINIVTNHIGKFKKIEEKLYKEDGILINLTNNRRKSLFKAKLILNIDFPKELINEFAIYDNSTIINWEDNLKIRKKRFSGKIIEEINLDLSENSEITEFIKQNNLEKYDERDVCQVLEYKCKTNGCFRMLF